VGVAHHHHTGTALVFHHEHDERDNSNISRLELGAECDDQQCPSMAPKKLVRPGYRTAIRTNRKGKPK
jgi:hypothetical protein